MSGKTAYKKSRISVTDVARMANVAHSTVSRVLNNNPNVSSRTREKILSIISATGYKPLWSARSLVSQRHNTIGLIFEREHINSLYGARLIEGICDRFAETGHRLAVGMMHWKSPAESIEELPLLSTVSVDGLILDLAQIRGDIDAVVSRLGVPYVYINPSGSRPYNAIMPDDVAAGRAATQYLIDRGHRRIAFMPHGKNLNHSSGTDRMHGYARAMSQAGLPLIPGWDEPIEQVYTPDDFARRLGMYHREHGCSAVVCYSTSEAMRTYIVAAQMQIRVPDDVALIGCDVSEAADLFPPSMPSVQLDRAEMGRMAVDMLLERIRNPHIDLPTAYHKGKILDNVLTLFTKELL